MEKCSSCNCLRFKNAMGYWHYGCYFNNKWQRWIPFRQIEIQTFCGGWKRREEELKPIGTEVAL